MIKTAKKIGMLMFAFVVCLSMSLSVFAYTALDDDGDRSKLEAGTMGVVYTNIGMFRTNDADCKVTNEGDGTAKVVVKTTYTKSSNYDRMALTEYPTGTEEEIKGALDNIAITADNLGEDGKIADTIVEGEDTKYSAQFTFTIPVEDIGKKIPFVYSQGGNWKNKAYYLIVEKAKPFEYTGDTVQFIKKDGSEFAMWKAQEGTTAEIEGNQVKIHYVPKNKTTYGWLHNGGIFDELTKDVTVEADGTITLSYDKEKCGFAVPVAPIKIKDDKTTTEQYYLAIPAENKIITADYTAVDEALKKVPEDLTIYTEDTAKAVKKAVEAVERDLKAIDQTKVDAMASAIENAVASLKKPEAEKTDDKKNTPADTKGSAAVGTAFNSSNLSVKVTKTGEVAIQKNTNTKAKKVTIPATINYQGQTFKVTEIANKAFANNKKLTQVVIGKNVTKIGKQAFKGDKKLKKITFKGNLVKSIGKKAFNGINKKATFKAPKKVLKKYKKLIKKAGAPKTAKYKK